MLTAWPFIMAPVALQTTVLLAVSHDPSTWTPPPSHTHFWVWAGPRPVYFLIWMSLYLSCTWPIGVMYTLVWNSPTNWCISTWTKSINRCKHVNNRLRQQTNKQPQAIHCHTAKDVVEVSRAKLKSRAEQNPITRRLKDRAAKLGNKQGRHPPGLFPVTVWGCEHGAMALLKCAEPRIRCTQTFSSG